MGFTYATYPKDSRLVPLWKIFPYPIIESNIIYRAGGTDVAVADGGTGASTLNNLITFKNESYLFYQDFFLNYFLNLLFYDHQKVFFLKRY